MATTLLFVHGTGVRRQAFDATMAIIRGEVAAEMPGVEVRPCFWGEDYGVRFHHGGRSVPDYDTARGPVDVDPMSYEMAAWGRLLEDPFFELRLIVEMEPTGGPVPGTRALPAEELWAAVRNLAEERPCPVRVVLPGWQETLEATLEHLSDDMAFEELVQAVPSKDQESELAVARAIGASALIVGIDEGLPALDGDTRDALVADLLAQIGTGRRAGMLSRLAKPLEGLATRWATKRRGRVSDALLKEPGDILLYQGRGENLRCFIRQTIASCGDRVLLFAHSLGGIMAVDLLAQQDMPTVKGLVTVGSQAPYLYETGALVSLAPDQKLPARFPAWLNIFDKADLLSYKAGLVFPDDRIEDFEVVSRQPFPVSHSAYFGSVPVWRKIAQFAGSLT